MKILIFLSGNITNGLESPTAGEGRWGQNLAKMLAENGHEVDCIAGHRWNLPSWGNTIPPPNTTLSIRPNWNIEYDLSIYSPWEHQFNGPRWEGCLTLPVKARYHVHCTFSWGQSIKDDHTCYNNNHILAYPYIQEAHCFPPDKKDNPYPVFPLPLPIYRELAPVNIETRKDIMWSTKDVFHPDWPVGHHVPRIGLATLNSIKKLAQKHSFNTRFLSTRFFNPNTSHHARDMNVPALVASIPNSSCYELVPRDQLVKWMSTSRITTVVSGLLGSFGESIAAGSVPLCYAGHIQRAAAEKHGIKLNVHDATEEEIYACMERLYEDDVFYSNVLADYRDELRYYSYAESYKYFKAMCKELDL